MIERAADRLPNTLAVDELQELPDDATNFRRIGEVMDDLISSIAVRWVARRANVTPEVAKVVIAAGALGARR